MLAFKPKLLTDGALRWLPRLVGRRAGTAPLPAHLTLQQRLFRENGFCLFPALFSAEEAQGIAEGLRRDAKIDRTRSFSTADVHRTLPSSRPIILDRRIRDAVEVTIGQGAKYLQVSDFVANKNAANWHRDSACRRYGQGYDWAEATETYACVKAIIYLECDNFAFAIVPGSHNRPFDWPEGKEFPLEAYRRLSTTEAISTSLCANANLQPALAFANPGDVIVFDERLYHRGQSLTADGKLPSCDAGLGTKTTGVKATLNLCHGLDNLHSRRFYSYFRYIRTDIEYAPLPTDFKEVLAEHNLLLSTGEENLFDTHPKQADGVFRKAT